MVVEAVATAAAALGSALLTYLLHSSLLLGAVAGAERQGWLARFGVAEAAWRAALLGAWLTTASALLLPSLTHWASASPEPTQTPPAAAIALPAAQPEPPPTVARAPAEPQRQAVTPGPDWLPATAAALGLLWAAGALLGLLAIAAQAAWLARRARRLPAWPDPALQQAAARWAADAGLRPPRLGRCARAASPWAWHGTIALPAWVHTELGPAERLAVLAHESAHLARRDPRWRLLQELAARLGWLQPLNRLALRRLDALAEAACDRDAARRTGGPQALAQGLVRCAEHLADRPRQARRAPRLAWAMASSHPLMARLRWLLESDPMNDASHTNPSPQRHARWALAGGLLVAALALPAAVVVKADWTAIPDWWPERWVGAMATWQGDWRGLGGHTVVRSSEPGAKRQLRWEGSVRFNDDETDVAQVDGPLVFEERRQGVLREWRVTPQADGRLQREYRMNGQAQALDADGQAWVTAMIQAAQDATQPPEKRAERLLARKGWDGALADLAQAPHDHARWQRSVGLLAAWPEAERSPEQASALLAQVLRIESAYEAWQALAHLGQHLALTEADWVRLLDRAAQLKGAFEQSELLEALAARLPATAPVQAAWVRSAQSIGGDHERGQALEAQLRLGQGDWRASVLAVAGTLGGDYERQQALGRVAGRLNADEHALMAAYLQAAQGMRGNFEHRGALEALLARQPRDAATLGALLAQAGTLGESFERSEVLKASAPLVRDDPALVTRYREAARGLPSFERGEVERALER